MISLASPHSKTSRSLVIWYGIYQAAHLLLNARYQLVPEAYRPPFPFVGPAGGWTPQTISFMSGMAIADLANALLTLIVVVGFFRQAPWVAWLGTVTLTVSLYAEIAFTWGALAAGAPALGIWYLWIHLPFVPIAVLCVAWWHWVTRAKLW